MKNSRFLEKETLDQKLEFVPKKEFVEKTKERFLAAYDAHHHTRPSSWYSGNAFRLAVSAFAVLAIAVSASVYADTKNVAADNPLYTFKRLGEKVQLAFTPATEKAQLQATFAVRRADEINDLQSRNPTSNIISGLNTDLSGAITASIDDQANADSQQKSSADFCSKFISTIGSVTSLAHDALLGHPEVVQRLEGQCGQDSSNSSIAGGIGASASSTISAASATTTPSSTTAAVSTTTNVTTTVTSTLPTVPTATTTTTSSSSSLQVNINL